MADALAATPPDVPDAAPPLPSVDDHVNAIIAHESGGDPTAVGDSGLALGLGQMHPEVRAAYGVTPNFTPDQQRAAVKSYFSDLLKKRGNPDDAVAEYHLGATNYDRDRHAPSTHLYLQKHKRFLARGGTVQPSGEGEAEAAPTDEKQYVRQAIADPKFWNLPPDERTVAMKSLDPDFAALPANEQAVAMKSLEPAGMQVTPAGEKPPWYSGLADEAGEKFATAVHNAVESIKSLAGQAPDAQQNPENVSQVAHDLLGMLEPWTVPGEMTGVASKRAAAAGGAGPAGQRAAEIGGTVAGAMATPAPPGFGYASRAIGRLFSTAKSAVPEAVTAARAEAPEAAAAAERVAGTPATAGEAVAPSAREVLAPSGVTPEAAGATVKTTLAGRASSLEEMAGGVYDTAVANAQAEGKFLDPARYQALSDHLKDVRATLGGQLSTDAETAISNLETKINVGQKVTPDDLAAYKKAVDTTFPGRMKSGTEVRDALRSMFSDEDRSWAEAADGLWRDQLRGRGMTETSLGNLNKLVKKSDPAAVVQKVFGSGEGVISDRQAALGRAVLRNMEAEAPEKAAQLKDAIFDRMVTKAEDATGNLDGQALLKAYDNLKPVHDVIAGKDQKAFFTVLRNALAGSAEAKPGMLARMTAEGIEILGGGAIGEMLGHPYIGMIAARHLIPPQKIAAALSDPRFLRVLTRAMQTPVNSAIAPTILREITKPTERQRNAPIEARQQGGPIESGKPYLVGEKGPEVIVPKEPGIVIPNMPSNLLGPTGKVFIHPDRRSYSTHLNTIVTMEGKAVRVPLLVPEQKDIPSLLAGKSPTKEQMDTSIQWARKNWNALPKSDSVEDAEAAEMKWHDAVAAQQSQYVRPYLNAGDSGAVQ